MMTLATLREHVRTFQAQYDADYEYGINDEDAEKGLLAVLSASGAITQENADALRAEIAELAECKRIIDEAWRAAHPRATLGLGLEGGFGRFVSPSVFDGIIGVNVHVSPERMRQDTEDLRRIEGCIRRP